MNTKVEERGNVPAMPTISFERDNYGRVKLEGKHIQRKGLTIREHFAGLAMQGLIAAGQATTGDYALELRDRAYRIADLMASPINQEQVK